MQTWEIVWRDTTFVLPIFTSDDVALTDNVIGDKIQIINILKLQHPEVEPEEVLNVHLVNSIRA